MRKRERKPLTRHLAGILSVLFLAVFAVLTVSSQEGEQARRQEGEQARNQEAEQAGNQEAGEMIRSGTQEGWQEENGLQEADIRAEAMNKRGKTILDKGLTLQAPFRVEGDLVVQSSVDLNGYSLEVSGDVLMDSDIDLNGGSLLISGSLHQVNAGLSVHKGFLRVQGSYCIEGTQADEQGVMEPSYGWIKMEEPEDRIQILGDFWARSYNSSILTAGRMEFGGNVSDYMGNTLRAGGTHVAHFAAARDRILVDLQCGASFQSISTDGSQVRFKQLGVNQLTQDVTLYGDVEELCSRLDLDGHTLTLEGDVKKVSAEINLRGGELVVSGSFHQVDPCIDFQGGTLRVAGDYLIEGLEKGEEGIPSASYGWLKMETPQDLLVVGGQFSARSYNSSLLKNGIMEFKGDVTDHTGNTLQGSQEHKAVFSGDGLQKVDLKNPSACFESISTPNERVTFLQMGIHRLTEDIVLTGDTLDIWNSCDLNGYQLTLRGNVGKDSAEITLNGGKLHVTGDFLQEDPAIYFSQGTLQVDGDYRIESQEREDTGEPKTSYGWLKMENPRDSLIVGGDFSAKSYNSSLLTAGTMEFKGNVRDITGNTLRGEGEHKAIFSGEGRSQVVDLQSESACFDSIRTLNDKVTFLQLGIHRLTEDITLGGDIETIANGLDLNGYTLTVRGSVKKACGKLDLNGGVLHVEKDFRLLDPLLYFHQGTLQVDGDFTLAGAETDEEGLPKTSYGWLKMEDDKDYLLVGGQFWANSYNSSSLSAGTMEFRGNVKDIQGHTLCCEGSHRAVFSGEGEQAVEFLNSSACFQSVRTENERVQFKTLGIRQLTQDISLTGDVEKIWNSLDCNGHCLTIHGSVNALMSDLDLNGGMLHVTGDFCHLDPSIWFHKGTLRIDGNYRLQSPERNPDGDFQTVYGWLKMENGEDRMLVSGDFIAQSYNSSVLQGGAIEVGGEIIDHTGNTLKWDGLTWIGQAPDGPKGEEPQIEGQQEEVSQTGPGGREEEMVLTPSPVPTDALNPAASPAADAQPEQQAYLRVQEKDKRFDLYQSEDGSFQDAKRIPVYTWRIAGESEVDEARLEMTGDGGCLLKVSYTPATNPFAEGPSVQVLCTYEGKEYFGSWSEGMIFISEEEEEEEEGAISPDHRDLIDKIQGATPSLLPPGIIQGGRIRFKAYPQPGLTITGYEMAVKEGDGGEWRTVKSVEEEADMAAEFPSLKLGETYWYKYRYYLTLGGADYYSHWTGGEMGDVYTLYD